MKKAHLFSIFIICALVVNAQIMKISVNSIKEFRTEQQYNIKRYYIVMKNNKKHELFNEPQYNAAMNLFSVKDSIIIQAK